MTVSEECKKNRHNNEVSDKHMSEQKDRNDWTIQSYNYVKLIRCT